MASAVKNLAEKWYKKLDFPRKYDEKFHELINSEDGFSEMKFENFDLEKNADEHRRNVIWALYFCEEVSEKYKEKNIPEEIMMDTLLDIRFHILKFSEPTGVLHLRGLSTWVFLHLSFKLFKVGRLQYQLRGSEPGAEHLGLPEGEPVLAVHIPMGDPLTKEASLESFDLANKFFDKYFPEYKYRFFTCHSWLLDKTLNNFLAPDTNIIKFQNLYEYACERELDSAISFCFPYGVKRDNIKDFEPKTSLQAKIRDHVLAQGKLYYTFGIREKYKDLKVPIALNIDDFTPIMHLCAKHLKATEDGREFLKEVPYEFLLEFLELVEKYGVRGKLSVVPFPAGENVFDTQEGQKWCEKTHEKLDGKFSYCPEMLTHERAYDIKNKCFFDVNERKWSEDKSEDELCEYITYALETLEKRGFQASGVTSPWTFGQKNLKEYEAAISRAMKNAFGKNHSWYFLLTDEFAKAKTVLQNKERRLVSIFATSPDVFWECINTTRADEEYIQSIADHLITEDGTDGSIIRTLENGGHPVILTHWQSLFSNGTKSGLRALEVTLERIKKHLNDRVEFASFDEILNLTIKENR